jgi:hypothetical protein
MDLRSTFEIPIRTEKYIVKPKTNPEGFPVPPCNHLWALGSTPGPPVQVKEMLPAGTVRTLFNQRSQHDDRWQASKISLLLLFLLYRGVHTLYRTIHYVTTLLSLLL